MASRASGTDHPSTQLTKASASVSVSDKSGRDDVSANPVSVSASDSVQSNPVSVSASDSVQSSALVSAQAVTVNPVRRSSRSHSRSSRSSQDRPVASKSAASQASVGSSSMSATPSAPSSTPSAVSSLPSDASRKQAFPLLVPPVPFVPPAPAPPSRTVSVGSSRRRSSGVGPAASPAPVAGSARVAAQLHDTVPHDTVPPLPPSSSAAQQQVPLPPPSAHSSVLMPQQQPDAQDAASLSPSEEAETVSEVARDSAELPVQCLRLLPASAAAAFVVNLKIPGPGPSRY